MSLAEQETIILMNDADRALGYFQLGTSKQSVFDRVTRRIGGRDNFIEVRESRVTGSDQVSW